MKDLSRVLPIIVIMMLLLCPGPCLAMADPIIIPDLSGDINAYKEKDARGLSSDGPMTITNLSGNVSATAGRRWAQGLYSFGPMTITNLSGNVSATAGRDGAYGLYSFGPMTISNLSGNVSAEANGPAMAVASECSMNLRITGTLSGIDSSGGGNGYAIRAGRYDFDRAWKIIWIPGSADNIITLDTGAHLIGKIDLGTGNNTLNLFGTGYLNNSFTGVTNLYVGDTANPSRWTLDHVSGTFGNMTVNPHAVLAVKGTVNVGGTYIHKKGATYETWITTNEHSIIKADEATIEGGRLGIGIDTVNRFFPAGQTYNNYVVQANTVAGQFDNVQMISPLFNASVVYNPANVNVILKRSPFDTVSQTKNEYATGRYLEDVYNARAMNDVTGAILNLASSSDIRLAYNEVSGLTHTAMPAATFSVFSEYMDVMRGRMHSFLSGTPSSMFAGLPTMLSSRSDMGSDAGNTLLAALGALGQERSPAPAWGFFAQGYGGLGQRRGDDISSKYDYNTAGITMGFDRDITPSLLLGGTLGYSYTKLTMKDLSDDDRIRSYQGSLYGIYKQGPWYVSGIAAYGYNDNDTTRDIIFSGITRSATANYGSHLLGGYIETGYKLPTKYADVIPLASIQGSYLRRNSFTEEDAGSLSLSADKENYSSLISSLGVRIRKDIPITEGTITPEIRLRWDHEFSNDNYNLNASFAGFPTSTFTVTGDRPDRDRLVAGFAVIRQTTGNLSVYLSYDGSFSGDSALHTGGMGVRYGW